MGYLGWKNHETHAAWQEILRHQEDIVPIVFVVLEAGGKQVRKKMQAALAQWFRDRMPLQEGDLDFWGLMVALGYGQVDFDQIGLHIVRQEERYARDEDGGRKQDWSPRKPRWS